MRMIDADALIERKCKTYTKGDCKHCTFWGDTWCDCNLTGMDLNNAPTLTQPNEPLTIAQLREMDGEPVYWPKEKMWLIVYLNHPDFGDCALNREGQYLPLDKCERRKVYRRPPEGEESKLT